MNSKKAIMKIDGEDIKRCPLSMVDGVTSVLVNMWITFKDGMLPFQGGYYDQPNLIVEAFTILSSFYNERMEVMKNGA